MYELPYLISRFTANFLSLNPNKYCYIVCTGSRNKLSDDPNKIIG